MTFTISNEINWIFSNESENESIDNSNYPKVLNGIIANDPNDCITESEIDNNNKTLTVTIRKQEDSNYFPSFVFCAKNLDNRTIYCSPDPTIVVRRRK